jgi:glutamine phosphoribosylpyrophosphate amidotransferase
MCGIVGYLDKRGRVGMPTGRLIMRMLDALACRGPDSAGVALLGDPSTDEAWTVRIAAAEAPPPGRLEHLGRVTDFQSRGGSHRFRFEPAHGATPDAIEAALGARRGGLEVLSVGVQLDLVKQVGTPAQLEAASGVSSWCGPLAIGHTRMSTESRIDLSHSQPFWAHGTLDIATVHNGHVTNYHQLRRRYEQQGVTFTTDNDSEVIGVYLRDRLDQGRTLQEALVDSLADLDGAYNYLVVAPEGLGVVRDRFGFKPLVVAETDDFVAVATEEIALRRALPGTYRVHEPPIGTALFYPLAVAGLVS